MFAKIAVLLAVACVLSGSDAYYLASPYAYPAYSSAVYSPYAYNGVYTGAYASAYYPSYFGWGSNKGGPAPATATGGLTNNQ